jgi:hypothetical protein
METVLRGGNNKGLRPTQSPACHVCLSFFGGPLVGWLLLSADSSHEYLFSPRCILPC